MDTKYRNDLMSVMLAPENVIAVGEILQLQDDWLFEIINSHIWLPLEKYAKTKEMKFGKQCEYGEGGAWISREEWKHYGIFVWTDRKNDWYNMYVGVSWFEEPNKHNMIYKKDYQKLNCLSESPINGWPYGWEFLPEDIRNWRFNITEEIVQGRVFDYIKMKFEEILTEIDQLQLPMP